MKSKTDKERFAIMETEITHIKKNVNEIKTSAESNFQEIKNLIKEHNQQSDLKFDNLMENKADKQEVNLLHDKVNRVVFGALLSLISILVGVVAFLIKEQLFS